MFSSTETNSDKSDGCAEHLSSQVSKWCQILNELCHFNGSRYSVGMLWQAEHIKLPNNFGQAKAHFISLERPLEKTPEIKTLYSETIKADLAKGYVRNLSLEEVKSTANSQQWYLPHHPVQNPHKPDKLRRFCNAACWFSKTSLNDVFLPCPDLLWDLFGTLIRFRLFPTAVYGDIEAMFMQVEVPVHEQNFLKIFVVGGCL